MDNSQISGQQNRSEVSGSISDEKFALFQEVYAKVTGKKDTTKRYFRDSYVVYFSDIETLHHKILQIANSYSFFKAKESFTIDYDDDDSDSCADFEKFRINGMSGSKAVETVTMQYDFLSRSEIGCSLYRIYIYISSGISISKKIQKDVPKIFWKDKGYTLGSLKIEYVDYSKAQNFVKNIDEWFSKLKKVKRNTFFKFIQDNSDKTYIITRNILLIIAALFSYIYINKNNIDSSGKASIIIISFTTILLVAYNIGKFIGDIIEESIDRIFPVAYIHLSEGDKRLKEETEENNKKNSLVIFYRIAMYIAVIFISVYIEFLITKYVLL